MSIYLKYRLEKSRIPLGDITDISIYAAKEEWIFRDLYAELANLFPTANITSFSDRLGQAGDAGAARCDLALIPFMSKTDTFKYKYSAARNVLKLKPHYIGFYEFGQRHLLVVKGKSLPLFFAGKLMEYGLRRILRLKPKITRSDSRESKPQ